MGVDEREMVGTQQREAPTAPARTVSADGGVTAVTADELGLQMDGQVDVPSETREKANAWIQSRLTDLSARVENYMTRLATMGPAGAQAVTGPQEATGELARPGTRTAGTQELGEPIHQGYVYWDLVSFAPIQFIGLPPYNPSKIIASGEVALSLAALFVNPATNVFNPISATTILGGRGFRVRFEEVNLTDVTNVPGVTFTGTFSSPAPVLTFFPAFFVAPDPGVNPRLMEQSVTADITDMAQPFAAFATNHFDLDADPGFLGIPPVPPQLQHDIPLRFLVYRK
jgi:hypothetical protein